MYRDQYASVAQLKDAISRHASGIPSEIPFIVVRNAIYRRTTVLISNARHVEKL